MKTIVAVTRVAGRALLAAGCVAGATAVLPAQADECAARVEWQGSSVRLRPHGNDFLFCRIDEAAYARLVHEALDADDDAKPLEGVALGRMGEYPWLSRALIDTTLSDPGWNTKRGKPAAGSINAYVATQLMLPAIRDRLAAPLAGSGLAIAGISVEKVLVRRVGDIVPDAKSPARRVPFDAQLWLRLEPVAK